MEEKDLKSKFNSLSDNEDIIENTKGKTNRQKLASIIVAAIVFILIIITGLSYIIGHQTKKDIKVNEAIRSSKTTGKTYKESKKYDIPHWGQSAYSAMSDDDKKLLMSSVKKGTFENMVVSYPSENDGFTSNPELEYDSDGLPNVYYTTATQEDIRYYTNLYLNRIINPVFGGWTEYQYGKEYDSTKMEKVIYSDMFTNDYLETNSTKLPFLTDKDKNDYGVSWPKSDEVHPYRYMGLVDEITDFKSNTDFDKFDVTAKVNVFGYTNDKLVEKKYTIKMTLVVDKTENETNRLKISEISVEEVK